MKTRFGLISAIFLSFFATINIYASDSEGEASDRVSFWNSREPEHLIPSSQLSSNPPPPAYQYEEVRGDQLVLLRQEFRGIVDAKFLEITSRLSAIEERLRVLESARPMEQKVLNITRSLEAIVVQPKAELITSQGGIIETNGLKMMVPKDAVNDNTQFSIKKASSEIQLPENVTPVTTSYEMEPHNVQFNDLVNLTFVIQDISKPVALFIQKDNPQDKQLKKWLVIDPKEIRDNTAVFEVRSFSFSFVGQMNMKKGVDLTKGAKPAIGYNIILPGLNYRAECEDTTCHESMIINRGFGKFTPNVEVDEQKINCSKCSKVLNEYESIKQIVLFQAMGNIVYRLDSKPKPPVQTTDFTAMGDRLVIYGEAGTTERYSSFSIDVKPQAFNFNPSRGAELKLGKDGNPEGSVFDLGADGAFKDIKLLIGKFYNGEGFTKDSFADHVGKALDKKGFDWYCTEDEDDFLLKLPNYRVAWVMSCFVSPKMKNVNFPDKLVDFYKSGKGLMLWEDNDSKPGMHTTSTLQKLFGMTVQGNDPGQQIMVPAANCTSNATFRKTHPITTGIERLHEGVTICYPTSTPKPLNVLATSSSGRPNIIYVDEDKTKSLGRVIIDCGFTKLFKDSWNKTPGTARYVINATCWLSGFSFDNT